MESFFLKNLKRTGITKNLGDDCALLTHFIKDKRHYVVAMDSFAQDIHFLMSHNKDSNKWLSYENLAKKAFLVNISDIISSGALPKYALLSITLPRGINKIEILEIINGIKEICDIYNICIIGGDTTKGKNLAFHITLIGELQGNYLNRNNIRNGDFVAYTSARTQDLGRSFKALKNLLRYGSKINKIPKNVLEIKSAYAKFCAPILRDKFLFKAQKLLHACMDISDGLAAEISRLEKLNAMHFLPFKILKKDVYQSGEEYELLFTFNPKNLNALRKIAQQTRIKIHIIGKFGRFRKTNIKAINWN